MRFDVKRNAKRGIVIGAANKIILMILPFVVRAVINNRLGSEFLGLNSLFSSIIQVLTLSELGFSSALVFHMYQPIAENNQGKINALLSLYRKAYFVIGTVIMVIGICVMPFLPLLIHGEYPQSVNIYIIFFLQLVNTSISYFLFGYKQSLLVAYQREDVNALINLIVQMALQLSQIALLLITNNYYLYVICIPFFTIVNNVWIGFITKRMFPLAKPYGKLENSVLLEIKKLVAGTFIQKACAVTRNSFDSICLSAFVGLSLTGIYNNYYSILSGVTLMLGIISTSLAGGIGNHVALKSKEENFNELAKLDFLYMNISTFCTVVLLCLYQPFMELWMGKDMTLPFIAIPLFCLYFYILKMGDMRSLYSAANGLWWKMRYRSIVETISNILLNVSLGKLFGVNGIIIATVISIFICNFLWSTSILFKEYFGKHLMRKYFLYHAKYAIFMMAVCAISIVIIRYINIENCFLRLIMCGAIGSAVFVIAFLFVYGRSRVLKESITMIKK